MRIIANDSNRLTGLKGHEGLIVNVGCVNFSCACTQVPAYVCAYALIACIDLSFFTWK